MGIKCKIKCDIAGSIKARLIDTRNGKTKEINKPNMLLSDYLDYYFQSSIDLLDSNTFGTCHLGTGTTPPARNQTGLQGVVLATSSAETIIKEFDTKERSPFELIAFYGRGGTMNSVAFSPDGTKIASGISNDDVDVWDATTGRLIARHTGHFHPVNSVAFSPDGSKIVSGGNDNRVRLWDAATGDAIDAHSSHGDFVNSVAFSPDGSRIVSGGDDGTAKVWDFLAGSITTNFTGHVGWINSVDFSPDGSKVVSGGNDDTAKVWDSTTGNIITNYTGHSATISSVAFSPDGTRVVSGSFDDTAHVWDAATGDTIATFAAHRDLVRSVAFSPDGSKVVSGSNDRSIKVWDATTGNIITAYFGHGGTAMSAVFSPDGSRIVSGSTDSFSRVLKSFNVVQEKEMIAKWVFDPGIGTGTINEVGLTGSGNRWVARQVIVPGIVKESYHRLEIEWKIKVSNTPGVWSGTIIGGNRDGTDVQYKFFIGNRCFIDTVHSSAFKGFILYKFTAHLETGTSNADSDLVSDFFIIGKSIDGVVLPYEVTREPYVDGSYERSFRIGLNSDQGNHADKLGEILLMGGTDYYFGRVTFNPKLDKIPTYRLYLDFKFSLNPS